MFRLPLRTRAMAEESDLSNKSVSVDDLRKLFEVFRNDLMECLMFLNHIRSITLTEIDSKTGRLMNTYTACPDLDPPDMQQREEFSKFISHVGRKLGEGAMDTWSVPCKDVSYFINLGDSQGVSEKWLVRQRMGFETPVDISSQLKESFRNKDLCLLPRGSIAARIDRVECQKSQSKLYCFLPLPVKSPLPVHVNGHFALDHENRRNIFYDEDERGPSTEWNTVLLTHVIAPSYVELMKNMTRLDLGPLDESFTFETTAGGSSNIEILRDLFPKYNPTVEGFVNVLIQSVYQYIDSSQAPVLPVVNYQRAGLKHNADDSITWMTTKGYRQAKPYFDNLDEIMGVSEDLSVSASGVPRKRLTSTPLKATHAELLRRTLLDCGLRLIYLPMAVHDAFMQSGVSVASVSPGVVIDFFKSYSEIDSACKLESLPRRINDTPVSGTERLLTVLRFCKRDVEYFLSQLEGMPLLLCEDECLREFRASDPVYYTPFTDILPGCGRVIMHNQLFTEIFREVNFNGSEVARVLDVHLFAELLQDVIPSPWYKKENEYAEWVLEEGQLPTPAWLAKVWSFLRGEYEKALSKAVSTQSPRDIAKSILRPLDEWALLPAVCPADKTNGSNNSTNLPNVVLVPLGLATTIIDYSSTSVTNFASKAAFRKLAIPEICVDLIKSSETSYGNLNADFARLIVGNLENPQSILHALAFAFENGTQFKRKVNSEEALLILKYFSDCSGSWKDQKECVLMVRELPIFLTIHGEFEAVGPKLAYVLPSDIPQVGLTLWEKETEIVFLKRNQALETLFKVIGCASLTCNEVYDKFIFPNFHSLKTEDQIKHLEFIKNTKLAQLNGNELLCLVDSLHDLQFLQDEDGRYHTASEYCDPYNPVFKAMFGHSKRVFPPKPFCEFHWLEFMKKVGLQTEVSSQQVVFFAKQVAAEALTTPTEQTFNKARTLVMHMFQRPNLASEAILEDLAEIAFVPAAKVRGIHVKLHPAYESNISESHSQTFIRFQDGIPENHEQLVWSSRHLLSDWSNPYKLNAAEINWNYDLRSTDLCDFESYRNTVAQALGVFDAPRVEDVVCHLKNICYVASHRSSEADDIRPFMRAEVVKTIYRFLLQNALEDDSTRDALRNINCISIDLGCSFAKPSEVVIELYEEDQIIPYLYKLPTELGEFKKLFLYLGSTVSATAEQYAFVLQKIYEKTLGTKLHPNELRTAFKAVYELFTALKRHRELNVDVLYLPSTNGRLVPSNELIYNNYQIYSERISNFDVQFLVDLQECKLTSDSGNFDDLMRLLPEHVKPPKLTRVVSEHLEEASKKTVTTLGLCEKLKHQITSRAFAQGILRLIKHEHHRTGRKVKKEVLNKIQNLLKLVRVFGVDSLITYLSYNNVRIAESESQCECFAERIHEAGSEDEIWCIYIDNRVSLNEELLVTVAEVVNRIASGLISHSVHYIQPILSCAPHSIYRVLDRLKIRPDHSIDFKQPTLPDPGSFVPIEDHHLLNEDFNKFEAGEYVAFELADDGGGGQTFVYALIIDELHETLEEQTVLSTRYRINIGDERQPLEANATDLYKFHRVEGFVPRASLGSDSLHREGRIPSSPRSPRSRESYSSRTSLNGSLFEPTTPRVPKTPKRTVSSAEERIEEEVIENENVFAPSTPKEPKTRATPRHTRFSRTTPKQQEDEYQPFPGAHQEEQNIDEAQEQWEHEYAEGPQEEESGYMRFFHQKQQDDAAKQAEEEMMAEFPEQQQQQQQQEGEEVDGNQAPQSSIPELSDEKTMEELLDEVSDTLEEAWQMQEGQRKKIIKRLLLKWHPDKNLDNEKIATMVTQHIQSEMERLEQGLPRAGQYDELFKKFNFDPRNPFAGSSTFQKNFATAYQYFFEQVNQRAKEHRQQRERYKEFFAKEYSSSRPFEFGVPPSFSSSNPQPNHAKRFLKQAQEDLRAADNDYEAVEPAFEWVCFKAHQAAEKALKAAQFSVDAVTSFNHDLAFLAATIEDLELRRLAVKLQQIIGNASKLYNPDPIDFVIIPHEEYTKEMACDAVMCATDILERVKEFVELRE